MSYTPPHKMEVPPRLDSLLTIRVAPDIRDRLTAVAEAQGVSVSQIVREAVRVALDSTPTPTA